MFIDILVIVGGQHRDRRDAGEEGHELPPRADSMRGLLRHHHSSVEGLNLELRCRFCGCDVTARMLVPQGVAGIAAPDPSVGEELPLMDPSVDSRPAVVSGVLVVGYRELVVSVGDEGGAPLVRVTRPGGGPRR